MQPTQEYLLSKIPLYGDYYKYEKQKVPIDNKIKLLRAIRADLEKALKHPNPKMKNDDISNLKLRVSKIDQKIDLLNLKIKKEKVESTISFAGSVVGIASNLVMPGSSAVVSLGSRVTQSVIHNSFSDTLGEEKKNLGYESVKHIILTAGKSALKTAASENCSIM